MACRVRTLAGATFWIPAQTNPISAHHEYLILRVTPESTQSQARVHGTLRQKPMAWLSRRPAQSTLGLRRTTSLPRCRILHAPCSPTHRAPCSPTNRAPCSRTHRAHCSRTNRAHCSRTHRPNFSKKPSRGIPSSLELGVVVPNGTGLPLPHLPLTARAPNRTCLVDETKPRTRQVRQASTMRPTIRADDWSKPFTPLALCNQQAYPALPGLPKLPHKRIIAIFRVESISIFLTQCNANKRVTSNHPT